MNDIINKLKSKQIHELSDIDLDAEIYRTIQEIESSYILLNQTKKAVELTENLNEMFNYDFDYKPKKMPIGITFQELLLKALVFQKDDPFEYIRKRCIVIPKDDNVIEYLESVNLMYKLSKEKAIDFISNEIKLYDPKFKERNDKQFGNEIERIVSSDNVIPYSSNRNDDYVFKNDHILLEFKIVVEGTEDDRRINFESHGSPMRREVDNLIIDLTLKLFGREFKVNEIDSARVPKKLLEEFDGSTIFKTKSLIYERPKLTKRGAIHPVTGKTHFYCFAGLFLDYNQFCDIIKKGSLK